MTIRLKKIDGNLVIIIPESIARELELAEGTMLRIATKDGVIRMKKRSGRSLAELVKQISLEDCKPRSQELTDLLNDPPVGKEIW